MRTQDTRTNESDNKKQVTISSKCADNACIGIEHDAAGNVRIVNVQGGITITGFPITDEELHAFIAGAAGGDFNHLLRENRSLS